MFGTEDPKKIERAREGALEGVKGRRREEVLEIGRGIVRRELAPRFYPAGAGAHRPPPAPGPQGVRVVLLAGGPAALLGEDLGLDGVIGTRAKVDDRRPLHGRARRRALSPRREGPPRAARWPRREGIDLAQSYAYSDSLNDLPLLELVGNPVATNPDRSLLALARQRGWPVLDFRTGRRRALIASAAGATAAAAGGIGYGLGYAVGRRRARRRLSWWADGGRSAPWLPGSAGDPAATSRRARARCGRRAPLPLREVLRVRRRAPHGPAHADGRRRPHGPGSFTVTEHHQGAPGLAHGGVVAAAMDEAMGFLLWLLKTLAVTARIEVDFRRPVPVGSTLEL